MKKHPRYGGVSFSLFPRVPLDKLSRLLGSRAISRWNNGKPNNLRDSKVEEPARGKRGGGGEGQDPKSNVRNTSEGAWSEGQEVHR